MRDILFKAKRHDNGEWVEGYYCKRKHYCFDKRADDLKTVIITEFSSGGLVCYEVNPDTICQYTGLTDNYGCKIWENDILEWEFANIPSDYYECVWLEDECAFAFKNGNDYTNPVDCYDEYSDHFCMKVLGNIYDNPELLKGGGEDE